jgi:hypothetical protein
MRRKKLFDSYHATSSKKKNKQTQPTQNLHTPL